MRRRGVPGSPGTCRPWLRRSRACPRGGRALSSTASLSETFAPPRITSSGRTGSRITWRCSSSDFSRSPAALLADEGPRCRRWRRVPGAPCRRRRSRRRRRGRPGPERNPGRSASSPAWKRRFSSRISSPSPSVGDRRDAAARRCSPRRTRRRFRAARARWGATGRSDRLGRRWPRGRPRWEATMTRAPGVEQAAEGRQRGADARVVRDRAAGERDVQVRPDEDAAPRRSHRREARRAPDGHRRFSVPSAARGRRPGRSSPTRCRTRKAPWRSAPITLVLSASRIEECGLPDGSQLETRGSSQYWRMPFIGPSLARCMAALIASAVVDFFRASRQVHHRHVRRGHAHGEAVELALELRHHEADGAGRAGAGGDHETAAARARRRSLCGKSSVTWSFV